MVVVAVRDSLRHARVSCHFMQSNKLGGVQSEKQRRVSCSKCMITVSIICQHKTREVVAACMHLIIQPPPQVSKSHTGGGYECVCDFCLLVLTVLVSLSSAPALLLLLAAWPSWT